MILVTGGGGFLGTAIIQGLLAKGKSARSAARNTYPHLARLGVTQIQGDLADPAVARQAVSGCTAVLHCAAKAGIWGRNEDFERANVLATRNILAACRHEGVQRLVYTSSPSVVFTGKDMEGADESTPYPTRFKSEYAASKARAEQDVLAANGRELATVSLRPHLIWGPGDTQLVPRILERGRRGQLRRVGDTPCLVDTIYIDNAVHAHLLALERLTPGGPVAGKSYFISQDEPIPLWEMIDRILAADNQPPVQKRISAGAAYRAGYLLELLYSLLYLPGEPRMTRFLARELSTAHWFDIGAARRDLGYQPRISISEGLDELRRWLQNRN